MPQRQSHPQHVPEWKSFDRMVYIIVTYLHKLHNICWIDIITAGTVRGTPTPRFTLEGLSSCVSKSQGSLATDSVASSSSSKDSANGSSSVADTDTEADAYFVSFPALCHQSQAALCYVTVVQKLCLLLELACGVHSVDRVSPLLAAH